MEGNEIYLQNSAVLLHTNKWTIQNKTKDTIAIEASSERKNMLRSKFNLHVEDSKAPLREAEEDLSNWQDICVHGLGARVLLRQPPSQIDV